MADNATPTTDTSPTRLTVESAATELEGFLFTPDPVEDKSTPAKQTPRKAEPTEDERPEPLDPEDQSEESPEVEGEEPPDNDEDVDPDSENAAEEGADEPDVDERPAKEPAKHKVKVRGVEEEVTLEEALNGYSRQADYTRSKQELAKEREKFEKEEMPVARERTVKYAEGLKQIEEALTAITPKEPDWEKLAIEAPEDFARQKAMWDIQQKRVEAVKAERTKAEAEIRKDYDAQRAKFVQGERAKLLDLIPSWKDEKVAKAEKLEIVKYARSLDISDDDLQGLVLANAMVILRNSYLYDKSQKAKPAIRERIDRVKAATPGARDESRPAVTQQTRRMQRLAKTHSIKDAASVLENIPGLLD